MKSFFIMPIAVGFVWSAHVLAGDGPVTPHPPSASFEGCKNAEAIDGKKEQCKTSHDEVIKQCAPTPEDEAKQVQVSAFIAAGKAAEASKLAKEVATDVATRCCKAADGCDSDCGKYNDGPSCTSDDPSTVSTKNSERQRDATGVLQSVCKEARTRCINAQKQAKANGDTEKSDKDQQEQNKGQGSPQQMPQQQPQQSPEQPQSNNQDDNQDDCTKNPSSEKCMCASGNSRACVQAQLAQTAGFGPGTFAGEHASSDGGSGGSLGSNGSSFTPTDAPVGGSSGGSGGGGGGMAGVGGANAAAKAAEKADDKKKSNFNGSVFGGSDGGGGGGGGGGYDDDGDGKGKKGGKNVGFALMGAKGPTTVAGFTKAGGRTNWEKVKIRYTDNSGTFMKDDKEFFCMGAECRKGPANAAAAASAAAAAAAATPQAPAAKSASATPVPAAATEKEKPKDAKKTP